MHEQFNNNVKEKWMVKKPEEDRVRPSYFLTDAFYTSN